jgi:predicted heme/steroid binding protein
MKKFTLEELADYRGQHGNPVYIAYKGKVYDVSSSSLWEDGIHQDEHQSGNDLTKEIADAPHDPDLLEDFPIVGELEET